MAMQVRAQTTRATIIQAAVDIFDEVGYGDTGLVDILHRAGVSKGAFYYHFPTKESLAVAIIHEAYARIREDIAPTNHEPASSALENLIRASFAVAGSIRSDQLVRVGHHLRQALPADRGVELAGFAARRPLFVDAVEAAIAEGDILSDVDAGEVADTVRATLVGINVLLGATDDAVFAYLTATWRVILRAIVPAPLLPYFREFVARTAHQFTGSLAAQAR